MAIHRRGLLGLLGVAGVGASAACATTAEPQTQARFDHGAASGDPAADSVVLWTRATPLTPGAPVTVRWEVAADPAFAAIVAQGEARTDAARDHTVKVIATGLNPGAEYHYRFLSGEAQVSGRTRTLPAAGVSEVVFAVASCALYPNGYFNAYRAIADLPRVDAVIHLGDYIYEYGGAAADYGMGSPVAAERRHDPPHEILTLDDYRRRHAQYKSDPDLQAAHARAPWITVWDDHETANNSWLGGAQNHNDGEGDWAARKAVALKAYYEWMPIREPAPGRSAQMADRTFQFGDLATLVMTETRLTARDEALDYATDLPIVEGKPDFDAFKAKWLDPERRLIGPEQHARLGQALSASVQAGTAWQVLGNQVVMAKVAAPDFRTQMGPAAFDAFVATLPDEYQGPVSRLSLLGSQGLPYNLDAWDGYPADRARLHALFKQAGARPIVLAGDSHAFWGNELYDADDDRVAVEFGVTSVASPGVGDVIRDVPLNEGFASANKEVVFCDQAAKGFLLLTLTRESAEARMMAVSTIHARDFTTAPLRIFVARPAAGGGLAALEATAG